MIKSILAAAALASLATAAGATVVIDQPGPTPEQVGSYVVPAAGAFSFAVLYGECCTLPSTLVFERNGAPVSATSIEVWQNQAVGAAFGTVAPTGLPDTALTGGASVAFNLGADPSSNGTLGQFAASGGWLADPAHAGDALGDGVAWGTGTVFRVRGALDLQAGDTLRLAHDDGASLALTARTAVPEPTSLALLGLGVLGVLGARRRSRR